MESYHAAMRSSSSGLVGITAAPHRRRSGLGTSHHLTSRFLAFEAGVKQRSIFEHGAGDVEETVTDSAESAGMTTVRSHIFPVRRATP